MGEENTITIAGRYEQVKKACQFVARGAAAAGLDEQAVFHIELCCDEACTNIIEHAYGGEDIGEITVSYQAEDDSFVITIYDNGRSFQPESVLPPKSVRVQDPQETAENLQIGGLGIHFMRQLMDEIQFVFDKSEGNKLIMTKTIKT
ncbi:MAG: ATP-binding protein [Chloroflexota bacterium]